MGYRLADDQIILDALKSALENRKQMSSQRELRERVLRELHKTDPGLTASGSRLRRLAITSGLARVEIEWRQTGQKRARAHCPVCGSTLRPTRNETVFGGTVTLGFRCPLCPFRTSMKRKEPTRYMFMRKSP
jgi:prepilin signal peptidase PulO-like enzyme (type II secretory pathway)